MTDPTENPTSAAETERLRREVEVLTESLRAQRLADNLLGNRYLGIEESMSSRVFPAVLFSHKVLKRLSYFARRFKVKVQSAVRPQRPTALGSPSAPVATPPSSDPTAASVTASVDITPPPAQALPPMPVRLAQLGVSGLRTLKAVVGQVRTGPAVIGGSTWVEYTNWALTFDTLDAGRVKELTRQMSTCGELPAITVVMALYNSDTHYLAEAIDSVQEQLYENWRLIMVDDGSPKPDALRLARERAAADDRITVIANATNGGISAATNTALEHVETEWVSFMDHDDRLPAHALLHVGLRIARDDQLALLYTDEDKIDEVGRRYNPYFKCDFDPLLLLAQNYMAHFVTVKTALVRDVGCLRSSFDGAQDWDLMLRVSERLDERQIAHIPHVLYHWRAYPGSTSLSTDEKPYAVESGRLAVTDALLRRDIDGSVTRLPGRDHLRVHYAVSDPAPLVNIMIPTRDGKYLKGCLDSLLEKTSYPNFRVTVIDNGSVKAETVAFLSSLDARVSVLRDDSPFNYAALHNRAVPQIEGEYLLLLNDDTEIIESQWLTEMVALCSQDGVGATGAKLFYPDGRIQHAGVICAPHGPDHPFKFEAGNSPGYFCRMLVAQRFSAVTAACMLTRRTTWEALGGMDETLAVAFNDVDYCLRVTRLGQAVTWTPEAALIHHESVSRGLDVEGESFRRFLVECDLMRDRWAVLYEHDPAYNPNLGKPGRMFELAWPPRVSPWFLGIL